MSQACTDKVAAGSASLGQLARAVRRAVERVGEDGALMHVLAKDWLSRQVRACLGFASSHSCLLRAPPRFRSPLDSERCMAPCVHLRLPPLPPLGAQAGYPACAEWCGMEPFRPKDNDVLLTNWDWDARALDFGTGPAVWMQGAVPLPAMMASLVTDLRSQVGGCGASGCLGTSFKGTMVARPSVWTPRREQVVISRLARHERQTCEHGVTCVAAGGQLKSAAWPSPGHGCVWAQVESPSELPGTWVTVHGNAQQLEELRELEEEF